MPTSDPRLLLLATAALLEGWFGPVVLPDRVVHGVIVGHGWDDLVYVWAGGSVEGYRALDLLLNLSRAEVRDRVARVVAGWRWRVDLDGGSVSWGHQPVEHERHRWTLESNRGVMEFRPSWARKHEGNIPALADLDPSSDTRLPDGSRLVDALALGAVVRVVLGVAS